MHNEGLEFRDIAKRLGISSSSAWAIVQGITWNHVTGLKKRPSSAAKRVAQRVTGGEK